MDNFEQEKQEYYDKLNDYGKESDVLELLIENENNTTKFLELILYPKTKQELDLAKAVVDFFAITKEITLDQCDDFIKIEDNVMIKIYIEVIKALKNNDRESLNQIITKVNDTTNSKLTAEIVYNLYMISTYFEDYKKYIAEECGFNLDSLLEKARFVLFFRKAQELLNTDLIGSISLYQESADNDQRINTFINIINELRKIYDERNKTEYYGQK